MKSYNLFIALLISALGVSNCLYGQTTYTFTGSGNWSNDSNWDSNIEPPATLTAGDEIIINGSGTCDLNINYTLAAGANLIIKAGKKLDVDITGVGLFQVEGTLSIEATGEFVCKENTTIASGGKVENEGTFNHNTRIFTNNGELKSSNVLSISGSSPTNSGTISNSATFNTGSITNNSGGIITNEGNVNISSNIVNDGTFTNENGGMITNTASTLTNNGTFNNNFGATFNNNRLINNSGTGTFNNAGTLNHGNSDGDLFTNDGNFVNAGAFNITQDGGSKLVNNGTFTNNGTLTRNSGPTISNNGIIEGTGTITMTSFTNGASGTIAPGNSIGTLNINANFINNGTLDIEVDAASSDQLCISGNATINGTINLIFIFVPNLDPTEYVYTAISCASGYSGSPSITLSPAHTPSAMFPTYSNGVITIRLVVLPIELSSFSGQQVEKGIKLSWTTEAELNNNYLLIERSFDGVNFQKIGRVSGNGTTITPQEYNFMDENPGIGLNYYRLHQFDFDGSSEYHPIIVVPYDLDSDLTLQAFPNPVKEELEIQWSTLKEANAKLRLLNLNGETLQAFNLPAGSGTNILPVKDLAPGIYILQIRQQGKVQSVKFVKK